MLVDSFTKFNNFMNSTMYAMYPIDHRIQKNFYLTYPNIAIFVF